MCLYEKLMDVVTPTNQVQLRVALACCHQEE
jgi:hypothetical protein